MNDPEIHPETHEEFTEVHRPAQHLWVVVLIVLIGVGLTYGWLEHRSAQEAAAGRDQVQAELGQMRGQVDALTAKLTAARNAMEIQAAQQQQQAEQESASTPANQQAPGMRRTAAKRHAARPVEDPRWKQIRGELADQKMQIAETQKQIQEEQDNLTQTRSDLEGRLNSTRDELNGSIAKNHDELVALQRKGERNFYEFDLKKSKAFRSEGPLGLAVRKINTKHEYCDLEVVVNDNRLDKKHMNLYEPVLFYPEGYSQPLELVINNITKNSVHGYVSEPKYKPEVASNSAPANASNPSAAAPNPSNTSDPSQTQVSLQHRPAPQQ